MLYHSTVNRKKYYVQHSSNKDLTNWGQVTNICISKLTIIVSNNGLSPGRRQAIIWNNVWILLVWPLDTNFSEILIEIHTFSFNKICLKVLPSKWRPFCLGLNVLHSLWTCNDNATYVDLSYGASLVSSNSNLMFTFIIAMLQVISCCIHLYYCLGSDSIMNYEYGCTGALLDLTYRLYSK